jgi:hypothetical protein
MRDLVKTWPVRSVVLIKELAGADTCPACAAPLDTAKICISCEQDWHKYVPARYKWSPPGNE